MAKFLETYNLSKIHQEESENLKRQITPIETEAIIIKKKPPKKALDSMASQVNFTKHSEKN